MEPPVITIILPPNDRLPTILNSYDPTYLGPYPSSHLASSMSSHSPSHSDFTEEIRLDKEPLDNSPTAPFAYTTQTLVSMLESKNFGQLNSLGGVEGLMKGLGTNPSTGLSTTTGNDNPSNAFEATFQDRQRVYGTNVLSVRGSKSLLRLMWIALQDKILILLSFAAVLSLALGLYQDFGTNRPALAEPCLDNPDLLCSTAPVDWVEGVAIVIAIIIVVLVGSINDWKKERLFQTLDQKKDDRGVKVLRDGKEQIIDVKNVLVGDIALVEPGEIIPCDGVFLSGNDVRCDESGATGESDTIKKFTFGEVLANREANSNLKDCFLLSGAKVLEGVGRYVVIAVGENSFNGRIMMDLRGDSDPTPLQVKLNRLAGLVAKIAGLCGFGLFVALLIKFIVKPSKQYSDDSERVMDGFNIVIISLTLVVVAIPEGLPLAVTLALAYATKRMTKENLLVRVLSSCETMANATVVCTDKTGTLTTNSMVVVAGSIGVHNKFVAHLQQPENGCRSNADEVDDQGRRINPKDFTVDQGDLKGVLSPALQELLNQSIAVNSTAFEDKNPETGALEFVGSKTEVALLRFAKEQGWTDYRQTRDAAEVVHMIPFSSDRKAMGVVIKLPGKGYRLHLKGASEVLTQLCERHVVLDQPTSHIGVVASEITEETSINIRRTITFYAGQTFRTIALCYRDFSSWPPVGSGEEFSYATLAKDLTFISIMAIEDPLRPGVRNSIERCNKAGVKVKMCTGDNVLTARAIALQCGIFTPGGIIMEGPAFRSLSVFERLKVVPNLQVLARSSPTDKKILVETLKSLGDVVGVTGDGTNDGPALKVADVGFSMGISGTEVAKEASDIILMDDNFNSIIKAIMWGRCVNDAVRKFLQFQIAVNIAAVFITVISAIVSDHRVSVLSAVQLLWINIIMDTFAALALATDPASITQLDRLPEPRTAPLFSVDMAKQIFGQAAYQTAITLVFHFFGRQFLEYHPRIAAPQLKTLVFNAFVFCQIFNSLNCRRLDSKLNIFEGLSRNYGFILITAIEVAVQVCIIFVGGSAFSVVPLSGRDWGISIALGFVSIPLGALIRFIPNGPLERLGTAVGLISDPMSLPTKSAESQEQRRKEDIQALRGKAIMRGTRFGHLHNAGIELSILVATSIVPSSPTIARSTSSHPMTRISIPSHVDPVISLPRAENLLHPDTGPDDPIRKLLGDSPRA